MYETRIIACLTGAVSDDEEHLWCQLLTAKAASLCLPCGPTTLFGAFRIGLSLDPYRHGWRHIGGTVDCAPSRRACPARAVSDI